MPYQLHEFLLMLFNLSAPLWGIWAGIMLGGMVNRAVGIVIASFWAAILAGALWYQFVGSEGSARYLISHLERRDGFVGYNPEPVPWWLPSANIVLVITVILAIYLTPIVNYVLESRRIDHLTPWSHELKAVAAPISRILFKATVGYLLALGAILTGAIGAVFGMIAGFLFGIPAGFILGLFTGMNYEDAVFVFVYPGGGLGFLAGGGYFIIARAATITRRAVGQMNDIHNARLEDKRRLERARADAERQVAEAETAHTAHSIEQEARLRRAMKELQDE